ncbi:MAG: histidine kinase [Bacteroidota bacterium]
MTRREMNIELLGFDDRWLMIIGIPIVGVLMTVIMYPTYEAEMGVLMFMRCNTVTLMYTIIYWFVFRKIFLYFRNRFPNHRQSLKRIILQFTAVLISYFTIKQGIEFFLHEPIHRFIGADKPNAVAMKIGSLAVIFLILAIYEGIYFYTLLERSISEKEQLEKENIQSQLEGLKNQVNPHFLFNSLNTLTYLIPEDPRLAVRFVQKLSKVYRYILEIREQKLIPLSEELSFLESYVFLLKERFGNNLDVDINIPDAVKQMKVVPLSLQILIENAIKHNVISTEKPLHVEVFIEKDNRLIVRNNLQKKNQVMNSTKVGLRNIKNRYAFFTDKTVDVITSTSAFIVALPLIRIKDYSQVV